MPRHLPERFVDSTPYWAFRHEYLVECPACAGCARVAENPQVGQFDYPKYRGSARLACTQCGLVKDWDGTLRVPDDNGGYTGLVRSKSENGSWVSVDTGRRSHLNLVAGSERDPYFRALLWLRGEVRGHTLWANNEPHLEFLEQFVAAKLRENYPGYLKTMGAYLPEWMKASSNRGAVLRELSRMRATLLSER